MPGAEDVEHGGGASGIDLHFDKDVVLAGLGLPCVHPQLSTVTYLTPFGAPTVVLPVRRSSAGVLDRLCNGNVVVSHPVPGKHLAFDGRYLHGVPEVLRRAAPGAAAIGRRVTFLVNVWLNHRPFAVQRFPFARLPGARSMVASSMILNETIASALAEAGLFAPESHTIRGIGAGFTGEVSSANFTIRVDRIRVADEAGQDAEASENAILFTLKIPRLPTAAECSSHSNTASTFELCFEPGFEPNVLLGSEVTILEPVKDARKLKKQRTELF
jgi:hypothetical protein